MTKLKPLYCRYQGRIALVICPLPIWGMVDHIVERTRIRFDDGTEETVSTADIDVWGPLGFTTFAEWRRTGCVPAGRPRQ